MSRVAELTARTYRIERHDGDNDDLGSKCPRCNGEGERIIESGDLGYWIYRSDGGPIRGWLIECALCEGNGGTYRAEFEDLIFDSLGHDFVREIFLSVDNHYYITTYVNTARTQSEEMGMIETAYHHYDQYKEV